MHSAAEAPPATPNYEGSPSAGVLRSVLAPLFNVLKDYPDAEELVVNRPGELSIERGDGVWDTVLVTSLTFATLNSMALAVAKHTAQSFNETKPVLFGTLPTGERLTFVGPPAVSPGTISLTMRLVKNAHKRMSSYDGSDFFDRYVWTQKDPVMARLGTLSSTQQQLVELLAGGRLRDFLIEGVKKKLTIGILGETGSGKTFLMECLIQSIPSHERLITVESARELQLPDHRNKVQLLYSHFGTGAAALDAASLMTVTKRMKPSRVLLGECIGPEAFVFVNLVISGHSGPITTFHAKSIEAAKGRFVLMCREHPDAKLHTPQDLGELFDMSMDVLVQIVVDEPTSEEQQAKEKKHRYVSEVWFNPTAARA